MGKRKMTKESKSDETLALETEKQQEFVEKINSLPNEVRTWYAYG